MTVGLLAGLLAVAVFSPILALRTIAIDGTNRVDEALVRAAVEGQLGTPLALIDFERLERELSDFALIRSFVTETVPPSTLMIHIREREPLGAVQGPGGFELVDPAGIVVQTSPTRPEGFPLILLTGKATDSAAFAAVSEVLLALPQGVLTQVDSIVATTQDDVTFTLRGVGQSVVWGSADRSEFKARVFAAMLAQQDATVLLEYDVSAPESVVVTRK